ncbi:MAG: hypothetical protein U0U67_02455 [Chitinophagales bacterium]
MKSIKELLTYALELIYTNVNKMFQSQQQQYRLAFIITDDGAGRNDSE